MVLVACTSACGAQVVLEEGTGGATAGPSGTQTVGTSGSVATNASSSTGVTFCDSHDDCDPNVCIFATGQCAPPCTDGSCDACGPGSVCNGCATSSCPGCLDCVAACVPNTEGRCDEDDTCPPDLVCHYQIGFCVQPCISDDQCGGFAFCDLCATASCCSCKNCAGACVGGE